MITHAIEHTFKTARKKKWDKTYWAVDIHETILIPDYSIQDGPISFYPKAMEALRMMSEREDITLIVGPNRHPVTPETTVAYRDLGVDQLVVPIFGSSIDKLEVRLDALLETTAV